MIALRRNAKLRLQLWSDYKTISAYALVSFPTTKKRPEQRVRRIMKELVRGMTLPPMEIKAKSDDADENQSHHPNAKRIRRRDVSTQ